MENKKNLETISRSELLDLDILFVPSSAIRCINKMIKRDESNGMYIPKIHKVGVFSAMAMVEIARLFIYYEGGQFFYSLIKSIFR